MLERPAAGAEETLEAKVLELPAPAPKTMPSAEGLEDEAAAQPLLKAAGGESSN
jgi:hypothetical protein